MQAMLIRKSSQLLEMYLQMRAKVPIHANTHFTGYSFLLSCFFDVSCFHRFLLYFVSIFGSFHSSLSIPNKHISTNLPMVNPPFRTMPSFLNPTFSAALMDAMFCVSVQTMIREKQKLLVSKSLALYIKWSRIRKLTSIDLHYFIEGVVYD